MPPYFGLESPIDILDILDEDPGTPVAGQGWILRTPTSNAIGHSLMPWGLVLPAQGYSYQLCYYSTDGEITRTPLENP